jgi:hypothetical protein
MKDVGPMLKTAGMTQDPWTTRDLPVMRAVVDIYESDGEYLTRASAIDYFMKLSGYDTLRLVLARDIMSRSPFGQSERQGFE